MVMIAGFGTKSGADDEEDHAADTQRTGSDLPTVEGDGLCGQVGFQRDDLLLVVRDRIGCAGEGPECVCRR